MKTDNSALQTQLAQGIAGISQGFGAHAGLSGAEIVEAMVYGLATACAEMTSPENRVTCITEAAKLLLTYANPVTVDSPIQSLATH